MTSTLPASSRNCRGSHPERVAAHQRPSGPSHSTRTDPSTITSPTSTRSRTQIRPGIHGDHQHPQPSRSPPELTQVPIQIRGSGHERLRGRADFRVSCQTREGGLLAGDDAGVPSPDDMLDVYELDIG